MRSIPRMAAVLALLAAPLAVLASEPTPALDGNCPVCLVKMNKLVKGDSKISSVYDGKTYLFPSANQERMFDENPTAFAPVLGKDIEGTSEFAVDFHGSRYLFPGQKQLDMFVANPTKYTKH